jgi:hypothetical protein
MRLALAALLVLAPALAHAEDETDRAARTSVEEVIVRQPKPVVQKTMSGAKHMRSPALLVTGIVLSAGSTAAVIAGGVGAGSDDPGFQAFAPFLIQVGIITLGSGITMIVLGAWPVSF